MPFTPNPIQSSAVSLLAFVAMAGAAAGQTSSEAVPVVVQQVVQREVLAGQTFIGTVMPRRISKVGSAVEGRVMEFLVNEGDPVTAGQPMVKLRTVTLEIQLAGARAEHQLRRHELEELQNGSRPEEIEQARARMLAAQARRDYTRNKLDRLQKAYQRGATSIDELQDATSLAETAAQDTVAADAAYRLAVAGPRAEKIAQAEANVAIAAETVRHIEDQIERHTIEAPFDGYVAAEYTEVGHWVTKGDDVVDVVELANVDVDCMVAEQYIGQLTVGATARVEIPALAEQHFTGPVSYIVPWGELRSRNFPVKIRLDGIPQDGGPLLKPGMFARVTLPVGQTAAARMVPKDAVVLGRAVPAVFAVDVDGADPRQGVVRRVEVELGVASEGMIQVTGAINAGDRVVVEGNERLQSGQAVRF
jgi:RND family efflux transporter MFP subunit